MNKKNVKMFKQDKDFGDFYECELLKYFNTNPQLHGKITKTKDKFNVVDYVNSDWVCELKSRRISINDFETIMIGKNKLLLAENDTTTRQFRFYFVLKEGTFYWDFRDQNVEGIDPDYFFGMGGRCDRGKDERKQCGYIFASSLTLLTDTIYYGLAPML